MGEMGKTLSCGAESYITCLMLFCSVTSGLNAQDKDSRMLSMLNYEYGYVGKA